MTFLDHIQMRNGQLYPYFFKGVMTILVISVLGIMEELILIPE